MTRLLLTLACVGVTVGCVPAGAPTLTAGPAQGTVGASVRPAQCRTVKSEEQLAPILAEADDGASFCLAPGRYPGPVKLNPGTTLWGPADAVVHSSGEGTTLTLASRTRLLGLTVDGSGGRFDVLDAAVKLERGDDVEIAGVTVKNAVFGILLEQVKRATVRGNHIIGNGNKAMGLRGDGIRLWETYDSLVEDNLVEQSRDLVVWYSSNNVLRRNTVKSSRYGTHFMYSHRNVVAESHYAGNEVGIFVMYSRDLQVLDNLLVSSAGASGMGLGMKESGNLTVRGNRLFHNTLGIFVDNSPITAGEKNLFEGNEVRLGDVGVAFLSSTHDNTFRGNAFRDNHLPVRVESGGDALALTWEGNAFDDYAGYDLDGDGIGDVPYELSDLSNVLEQRNADLAFLRGTPAMALVALAGHAVPLLAPKPVLRDAHPRFGTTLFERVEGQQYATKETQNAR
jgi:nitrous oxidase accessory protein